MQVLDIGTKYEPAASLHLLPPIRKWVFPWGRKTLVPYKVLHFKTPEIKDGEGGVRILLLAPVLKRYKIKSGSSFGFRLIVHICIN